MAKDAVSTLWPDVEDQLRAAIPRDALEGLCVLGADINVLHELAGLHCQQWALEDQTRSTRATAKQIAQCKSAIDQHNSRRHQLIDAFDATYCYVPPKGDGRRFSETPGEMCDRLVIVALKIEHTRQARQDATVPDTVRERCEAAWHRLQAWQAYLSQCLVEMIQALGTGEALLPPRSEFKMYNDPWLNPVTRLETGMDNVLD